MLFIKIGDVMKAFPWKTYWLVVSDPVTHDTIEKGIAFVGWGELMPWARSAEETLVRYVELFGKRDAPGYGAEGLAWAREWDRGAREKKICTWFDRQVA